MKDLGSGNDCAAASCAAINGATGFYSVVSCPGTLASVSSQFSTTTTVLYGGTDTFTDNTCGTLSTSSYFIADGSCTYQGGSYYKYTANADGSLTIGVYSDNACTAVTTAPATTTKANLNTCASSAKKYLTINNIKTVTVYKDSSCNGQVQNIMILDAGITCVRAACAAVGSTTSYSTTTCGVDVTVPTIATLFSTTNKYGGLETYSDTTCATVTARTYFIADGTCTPQNGKSYKYTANADGSLTILKYSDLGCQTADSTTPTTTITSANLGTCDATNKVKNVVGNNKYSLVSVYKSTDCSGQLQDVVLTPVGGSCTAVACSTISGATTYSSVTTCTTTNVVSTLFGGAIKYGGQETYAEATCATLSAGKYFLADGSCSPQGGISYKYTANNDGSLTILKFSDLGCQNADTTTPTTTITSASLGTCDATNKLKSIIATGTYTSYSQSVAYAGSGCTGAVQSVSTTSLNTQCTQASCATVSGSTASSQTTCPTSFGTPGSLFATNAIYAGLEIYSDSSCATIKSSTYYLGDGSCVVQGTKSYKYLANSDSSITVNKYSDTACTTADGSASTITAAQVGACTSANGVNSKYVLVKPSTKSGKSFVYSLALFSIGLLIFVFTN